MSRHVEPNVRRSSNGWSKNTRVGRRLIQRLLLGLVAALAQASCTWTSETDEAKEMPSEERALDVKEKAQDSSPGEPQPANEPPPNEQEDDEGHITPEEDIGLDEEVKVPDIDVDSDVREPALP